MSILISLVIVMTGILILMPSNIMQLASFAMNSFKTNKSSWNFLVLVCTTLPVLTKHLRVEISDAYLAYKPFKEDNEWIIMIINL